MCTKLAFIIALSPAQAGLLRNCSLKGGENQRKLREKAHKFLFFISEIIWHLLRLSCADLALLPEELLIL